MDFVLISLAVVGLIIILIVAISAAHPGSGADLLGWGPSRSHEVDASLEAEDVQQMLDVQNERRRRSGRPELTEEGIRQDVDRDA